MYPAGYGFSSSEEDDFDFLVPSAVQSSQPAGDWVPSVRPAENLRPERKNPSDDVELEDPDLARLLARTKKNIRAVLTAVKGELELGRLEQEYYETFEENIPWPRLQFSSLEEMVAAMPSVCEVRNIMYSTTVRAVLDQNTDHIRQMVNYQKKSKKKVGRGQYQWRGPTYQDYQEYNFQPEEEEESWEPSPTVNPDWEDAEWKDPVQVTQQREERSPEFVEREEREERSPGLEEGEGRSPELVEREEGSAVETEEPSVWLRRVRELLRGRKFGLLLQHIELSYQREWGESLPADWRDQAEAGDKDLVFVEDRGRRRGSWVKLPTTAARGKLRE